MKKFNLLKMAAIAAVAFNLTSCNDQLDQVADSEAQGAGAAKPTKTIGSGNQTFFTGGTYNWDSDTIYIIRGFCRFRQSAVLNIEAGTIVKGESGSTGQEPGTLVIERSAKIFAIGTCTAPIVFTSDKPAGSRLPGDWGGILIMGRAYVNITTGVGTPPSLIKFEGSIEGVPAGVNPIYYGNQNSDPLVNYGDDSGVLSYVRIEYAGNVISDGNETNGLTLGGVGAGTVIDHVQVSFGADDGFEWFGGTVDQKYLIAYRNEDDDFDTDQGYYGRTQFGYILRDPKIRGAGSGGSRAFESNGDDDVAGTNLESVLADPAYSNITVIGPNPPDNAFFDGSAETACGYDWSPFGEYNDAIVIRDDAQLDLMNSVVAGFPRFVVNFTGAGSGNDDYNAGGIPAAYFYKNRFVYDRIINPLQDPSSVPTATFQVNNELRAATGCNNPAVDVAGKAGLKRAAWRLPDTAFDPKPAFSILNTSPLYGNTNPEKAQFTSTRFVNFLGNPYRGIQNNDTFWDKSVVFRGAADDNIDGWDCDGTEPISWAEWTPNLPAYN